jgi:23S rRNA (guanine745-N1)-methyltransferase
MSVMPTIFACPVCQGTLRHEPGRYACASGHAFDVAREGYVNLLLAHHKRSPEPGDNLEMIRSRRAFLEAGYYDALRDRLCGLVLPAAEGQTHVLDVGCGEGFYTGAVSEAQPALSVSALDVSKFAIKAAARRYRGVEFAVASAHRLPVHDRSLDYVLSIFAPRPASEIVRVLKPGGRLVLAVPGARHLRQLKQMIYAEPQPHTNRLEILADLALMTEDTLEYEMTLPDQQAIQHLLTMTPLAWHMSDQARQGLVDLAQLTTIVAFQILVYAKRGL